MDLEETTIRVKEKMQFAPHIRARVKFDFGDNGVIFIDTTQDPAEVCHENKESDVTLSCDLELFEGFLTGKRDPNIAFMMGRLHVKGSMPIALKLNSVLEE
ncbi:MAG: SCP-2 sterol transfer family protein [Alphaproteobacteria bacterium]|nr:SCP-2 sterol transfer family protein [Alphaproteobacteria bacterium]|tara:strand:- start:214 stop:516 length:303 start_codon:yes stop_codon:yes gene_type:complete